MRNISGHEITALHRAAVGTNGTITFFSRSSSPSSSSVRHSPEELPHEVRGSTQQTLMDEAGVDHIDLLKIDIEGAEFELLATAPLGRVNQISGEGHYDLGHGSEASLRALLTDFELDFQPLEYGPPGSRWHVRAHRLAPRLT